MYRGVSKGFRLHIGIFGRRNAGKSSLLNALVRQEVSVVSEIAGTTTDPVEKPMELLPLGPVLFIDTAGIDDEGALGQLRIEKTRKIFDRTDLAIIVAAEGEWGPFEQMLVDEFRDRQVPVLVVFNKADLGTPSPEVISQLESQELRWVFTVASRKEGLDQVRDALVALAPEHWLKSRPIINDLVPENSLVILVVPIDKEAPKGRLIQPQVQTLRELLDGNRVALVVKEHQLADALRRLREPPALVVTDSQAFAEVAAQTPLEVPLTGFSILYARQKGDLEELVRGVMALDRLRPGDHVLVAEACSHHPIEEDIGRVKIPRWVEKRVGGPLRWQTVQGHDFPEDLSPFKLVIHCGACMWNPRELLSRIWYCRKAAVPITNYGLAIAHLVGILPRALSPFPELRELVSAMTADGVPRASAAK